MSDLIAIGYNDETTAAAAADEARRLAKDLIIEADAIASIRRDAEGKYHVTTTHHAGRFRRHLGHVLGLAVRHALLRPGIRHGVRAPASALSMGKVTKTGIDKQFQEQVRGMVKPGTSALFLVVEKVTPDKAVEAMSRFGGTVLKSSLSKEAEKELQAELQGNATAAAASS